MNIAPSNIAQTALTGLSRATEQADTASKRIVAGPLEAEDVVSLKTAEHAFKANAAVLEVAKRMQERLLDIFA
ncbi:MAG: hypothetical protein HN732_01905 [Rhodospirillaceae bacterium]|jgi:hypothetical protein|nr:hypothetical protein [Rhodospirillaceae bacterium]